MDEPTYTPGIPGLRMVFLTGGAALLGEDERIRILDDAITVGALGWCAYIFTDVRQLNGRTR